MSEKFPDTSSITDSLLRHFSQNHNGNGLRMDLQSREVTDDHRRIRIERLTSRMLNIITIFPPEGTLGPEEEIRVHPRSSNLSVHQGRRAAQAVKLLEENYGEA